MANCLLVVLCPSRRSLRMSSAMKDLRDAFVMSISMDDRTIWSVKRTSFNAWVNVSLTLKQVRRFVFPWRCIRRLRWRFPCRFNGRCSTRIPHYATQWRPVKRRWTQRRAQRIAIDFSLNQRWHGKFIHFLIYFNYSIDYAIDDRLLRFFSLLTWAIIGPSQWLRVSLQSVSFDLNSSMQRVCLRRKSKRMN